MKLDRQTITWIEEVAGNMAHGVIQLIICDKQVVKVITEDRRVHERKRCAIDNPAKERIISG